jgi:hypothetical protein
MKGYRAILSIFLLLIICTESVKSPFEAIFGPPNGGARRSMVVGTALARQSADRKATKTPKASNNAEMAKYGRSALIDSDDPDILG